LKRQKGFGRPKKIESEHIDYMEGCIAEEEYISTLEIKNKLYEKYKLNFERQSICN
jgi:transposase